MTKTRIVKHLKLPLKFDAERLQKDLKKVLGSKWIDHFNIECYQGKWNSIPLYNTGGDKNNIVASPSINSEFVKETEHIGIVNILKKFSQSLSAHSFQ